MTAEQIADILLSPYERDSQAYLEHRPGMQYLAQRIVESLPPAQNLIASARKLVDILDDREKNHGALIGPETLNARNELALELSRWTR